MRANEGCCACSYATCLAGNCALQSATWVTTAAVHFEFSRNITMRNVTIEHGGGCALALSLSLSVSPLPMAVIPPAKAVPFACHREPFTSARTQMGCGSGRGCATRALSEGECLTWLRVGCASVRGLVTCKRQTCPETPRHAARVLTTARLCHSRAAALSPDLGPDGVQCDCR